MIIGHALSRRMEICTMRLFPLACRLLCTYLLSYVRNTSDSDWIERTEKNVYRRRKIKIPICARSPSEFMSISLLLSSIGAVGRLVWLTDKTPIDNTHNQAAKNSITHNYWLKRHRIKCGVRVLFHVWNWIIWCARLQDNSVQMFILCVGTKYTHMHARTRAFNIFFKHLGSGRYIH